MSPDGSGSPSSTVTIPIMSTGPSGAITTSNCDHVAISGVIARCASGPVKNASCIAIYSALPAGRVLASTARVQGCELIVGANQVGLSIINYGHTTVSDNVVRVDPVENAALPAWWLQDLGFRRSFRRTLIYRHGLVNDEGHPVPPGAPRVVHGPYAFMAHPNYVAVAGEIAGCAITAHAIVSGPVAFVLFGVLMLQRIRIEERALAVPPAVPRQTPATTRLN